MMSVQAAYQQKRVTAADAVSHLRNNDVIVVPTGVGETPTLLTELSEADLTGVRFQCDP